MDRGWFVCWCALICPDLGKHARHPSVGSGYVGSMHEVTHLACDRAQSIRVELVEVDVRLEARRVAYALNDGGSSTLRPRVSVRQLYQLLDHAARDDEALKPPDVTDGDPGLGGGGLATLSAIDAPLSAGEEGQ